MCNIGRYFVSFVFCAMMFCYVSSFNYDMISNRLSSLETKFLTHTNDTVQELSKMVDRLTKLQISQSDILSGGAAPSPSNSNPLVPLGVSCRNVPSRTSGIYRIDPDFPFQEPMTVLCDQQYEGGGWTVIQRRTDGTVNFFRDWQDYKRGFGTLHGEFWLGLEQIHRLTNSAPHELAVLLEDFDGVQAVARYDRFRIGAESSNYAMLELGKCMPCSMPSHLGEKFSTYDRDNGRAKFNCAEAYQGGWWHFFCHHAHLNGQYLKGKLANAKDAQGIIWMKFRDSSLKLSIMMIRPLRQ